MARRTVNQRAASKAANSSKKVYRSMTEIRRAFYPNAEKERTADRRGSRNPLSSHFETNAPRFGKTA